MSEELKSRIEGIFNPKEDILKSELPKSNEELKERIEKNYFNIKPTNEDYERDWADKSNKTLKERGSNNRVVNIIWHNFLIILLVISIIVGICFVSWGIYNDKFKTQITDNSMVICNSTTKCEGSNLSCPKCELNCGNVTVQIPETLKVTLENVTGISQ